MGVQQAEPCVIQWCPHAPPPGGGGWEFPAQRTMLIRILRPFLGTTPHDTVP